MLTSIVSYFDVVLYAISIGLGLVILWAAWYTLHPPKGVHLMWWHILTITVAVWILQTLFIIRVISDLRLFNSTTLLPGTIPSWYLYIATFSFILSDVAFWIILKVQRGRRHIQDCKV